MAQALVVDDAAVMRRLLRHHLEIMGFEVDEAANGQQALEKLDRLPDVTVALVDWNMPVMNGIECLKAIRANPRYSSLAVVIVTTETEMDYIVAALAAGANDYIMKPLTREIVAEKLLLLGLIDGQKT